MRLDICVGYLAYLRDKRGELEKALEKELAHPKDLRDFVNVIAWASLGPGYVAGLFALRELNSLGSFAERAAGDPRVWGEMGEARVGPPLFFHEVSGYPLAKRKIVVPGRATIPNSVKEAARELIPQDFEQRAYALGVLLEKHPWDPPECVSAAANMYWKATSHGYDPVVEVIQEVFERDWSRSLQSRIEQLGQEGGEH